LATQVIGAVLFSSQEKQPCSGPFITAALVTLLLTKIAAMSVWLSVFAIIVEVLLLLLIGVVLYIAAPIAWRRIKAARNRRVSQP
jgi:hypothetical protein